MRENAKKSKKLNSILVMLGLMVAGAVTILYILGGIMIFLHLR